MIKTSNFYLFYYLFIIYLEYLDYSKVCLVNFNKKDFVLKFADQNTF